jgi:putative GTP pyrophosphokinase
MQNDELIYAYQNRYEKVLVPIAIEIEKCLKDILKEYPRIDRIYARAKSPDSFIIKAQEKNGDKPLYTEPLRQIQDQIGARIISFYLSDVDPIGKIVSEYFAKIEEQRIEPASEKSFGYEGKHYIFLIPKSFITPDLQRGLCPDFCELQIITMFQHAWAEANHDLSYKPTKTLNWSQHRRVAYAAAQAWGADQIFLQLAKEIVDN